jgi:hypothetical protein
VLRVVVPPAFRRLSAGPHRPSGKSSRNPPTVAECLLLKKVGIKKGFALFVRT